MRILTTVLLVLISTGFTAVCTPASADPLSTVLERIFEWAKEYRKTLIEGGKVGATQGAEKVPEVVGGKDDDKGKNDKGNKSNMKGKGYSLWGSMLRNLNSENRSKSVFLRGRYNVSRCYQSCQRARKY